MLSFLSLCLFLAAPTRFAATALSIRGVLSENAMDKDSLDPAFWEEIAALHNVRKLQMEEVPGEEETPTTTEDPTKKKKKKKKNNKKKSKKSKPSVTPFIIGGFPADPDEYPFFVQMYWDGRGVGCGASLIGSNWILTAAHCVERSVMNDYVRFGYPQWRVGSYCRNGNELGSNCGARETIAESREILMHPQWNNSTLVWDYALVRLNMSIAETPVSLDDGSVYPSLAVGDAIRTLGMGWINDEQELPEILQEVYNFFYPLEQCRDKFRGGSNFDESVMCTNGEGVGQCRGDSGSPALVADPSTRTGWRQVGITSFGPTSCETGNVPDGYARVATVHSWIVDGVCPSFANAANPDIPDFCPNFVPAPGGGTIVTTDPPSHLPTTSPSDAPTHIPTSPPTLPPVRTKITSPPTVQPDPTESPTLAPSNNPTLAPTFRPTREPTNRPSHAPTEEPTLAPTDPPTTLPPSHSPTLRPTLRPTTSPTRKPTRNPTTRPTLKPTTDFELTDQEGDDKDIECYEHEYATFEWNGKIRDCYTVEQNFYKFCTEPDVKHDCPLSCFLEHCDGYEIDFEEVHCEEDRWSQFEWEEDEWFDCDHVHEDWDMFCDEEHVRIACPLSCDVEQCHHVSF